jgi:indole-3-glycerol phosphate synthase
MIETPDILRKIIAEKQPELDYLRSSGLGERYKDMCRSGDLPARGSFYDVVTLREGETNPRVVMEHKRASPRRQIRPYSSAFVSARDYFCAGAAAMSVLTERNYFMGRVEDLLAARAGAFGLPLLRKDFLTDELQIYESVVHGASAVLMIMSALQEHGRLRDLMGLARECGMDCLVEVHDEDELDVALKANPRIIGVNSRDLRTMKVDLGTIRELAKIVPRGKTLIGESGIHTRDDVASLNGLGIDALLIGEEFMKADDKAAKMAELGLAVRRGYNPPY